MFLETPAAVTMISTIKKQIDRHMQNINTLKRGLVLINSFKLVK